MMKRLAGVLVFVAIVVGGGLVIGYTNRPDGWFAALAKPWFNPPSWLFAPVWTMLYVLIGIAGWRAWSNAESRTPFAIWVVQLALNFAWSPTFFGAHRIGAALVIVALLLVTILAFMATSARTDRVSTALFAPYAAWVAFATALNGAIYALNG